MRPRAVTLRAIEEEQKKKHFTLSLANFVRGIERADNCNTAAPLAARCEVIPTAVYCPFNVIFQ